MTRFQDVFERYEMKYRMSLRQYAAFTGQIRQRTRPDAFGPHTICNIYYDTADYALIRASLEKPAYKEKLRLRSYGVPGVDSVVFLELKKKVQGVVYKRRVPMTLREAERYLSAGIRPERDGQILHEIDWFLHLYHPQPRVMIAYDRVALVDKENPEIRLTFDRNIRWRDRALDLSLGDRGALLTGRDEVLMEIKIPGAMPLWLCHLLDRLGLRCTSFSKYGTCYKNELSASAGQRGGIICA